MENKESPRNEKEEREVEKKFIQFHYCLHRTQRLNRSSIVVFKIDLQILSYEMNKLFCSPHFSSTLEIVIVVVVFSRGTLIILSIRHRTCC
ncbi:hypothetical protein BJY04DRAFT_179795 [Aspergillus karnatakaensis]|uniref:uncharacterized protein n=1 Tax=Aspergillus karnatakaensis TaxID=1810916 RepID=UPI003CCC944A